MVSPFREVLEFPVGPPIAEETFRDEFAPGPMELGTA